MYAVIRNTEDGVRVDFLSKEDLEQRLNEQYYGRMKISTKLPDTVDEYFADDTLVIVKAELVQPKPVTVITKYEV